MTMLLRSELLKLRTLRATWIACTVGLGLSAVIGLAQVRIAITDDSAGPVDLAGVARAPSQSLWFIGIVVALLVAAGEFQYRTIRTTLLVAPRRGQVLAAKCIAAAIVGTLLVAAGALVSVVAALATAHASDFSMASTTTSDWGHVAAAVAIGGVWSVVAVALGTVTRSIAVAITALLLWQFVGEALVPVVARNAAIGHWTPNGAASALTGGGGSDALAATTAGPLLAAYVVVLVAVAVVSFTRTERL